MNSRNLIQDELVELNSALPAHLHSPVFGLPQNYFENFASSVLDKLKKEEALSAADELSRLSPLLASVSKKPLYHVPQDYFLTLSNQLPAVTGEETLSPMLACIKRNMPNTVPIDYFDGFARAMLEKVAPPEARVVPMKTRWMRMAAAAVVIGFISVAGFFYLNQQNTSAGDNWVAHNLQSVSDQELEAFLNGAEAGKYQVAKKGTPAKEVNRLLRDVSTNEMDDFLAQVPTDDELFIVN